MKSSVVLTTAVLPKCIIIIDTHSLHLPNHSFFSFLSLLLKKILDLLVCTLPTMDKKEEKYNIKGIPSKIKVFLS